jgi:hypothetical protein
MFSTILLYAVGGYFGKRSKAQFDDDGWGPNPGPDDGPRPPWWWWFSAGIIGGLLGGYAVNYGISNDATLGALGSILGGRALSDVVSALKS